RKETPVEPPAPVETKTTEPTVAATADPCCVIEAPRAPAELGRRSAVPAEVNDMAKLREAANHQTRIAFDIHGRKQLFNRVATAWPAGISCAIGTLVLLH